MAASVLDCRLWDSRGNPLPAATVIQTRLPITSPYGPMERDLERGVGAVPLCRCSAAALRFLMNMTTFSYHDEEQDFSKITIFRREQSLRIGNDKYIVSVSDAKWSPLVMLRTQGLCSPVHRHGPMECGSERGV
eukprot:SM000370S13766  [mRNA]  locus=s370:24722:27699:+ [translate_table: standard]